ncbi:MAG: cytochrome c [Rhodospirillales bacterium]|jgi:cytochrome c556|nr:cytochrome c [Rhodospirillales bacterium]MDP6882630.1 cytochrome c [Rhodospirillales bacterium]
MTIFIRKLAVVGLLAGVLGLSLAGIAAADPAAEIKFRQNNMKALGSHMGALAAMVKGARPGSPLEIRTHAYAIGWMSRVAGELFPDGSGAGETRAKPEIWSQPDAFKKELRIFKVAAWKLELAAKDGDAAALGAALGGLGKTCGSCHKAFRAKKK